MDGGKVVVDSRLRFFGVMDMINVILVYGFEIRLLKEFYDEKVRGIIEKIGVEEWF